jgi:hypothetical protein
MRRYRWLAVLLLTPALALVFTVGGCGKKDKEKPSATKNEDEDKDTKDKGDDGSEEASDEAMKAVKPKGWGTLSGKVTLAGDVPEADSLEARMKDTAKSDPKQQHCLKAPKEQLMAQDWKVRKSDKAVANVVVWLRAEKPNEYIDLGPKDEWPKEWTETVKVDQPYCAFIPHVSVAFPDYWKDGKTTPTGQRFDVLNSAPIAHNTAIKGTRKQNPLKNVPITAGAPGKPTVVQFTIKSDTQPLSVNCDIHKWMTGYVWSLDTPFAAVTKGDEDKTAKDFGSYKIGKVPAGIPLRIFVWHEAKGYINDGGPKGQAIKPLKDGDNKMDFQIK